MTIFGIIMDFSFLRKNMVDCQLKPNKIINLNLIDASMRLRLIILFGFN